MAFNEFERIELRDARLLDCYEKHEQLWVEMADLAYKQAVDAVAPDPQPDDVVQFLLPSLRIRDEFRQCKSEAEGRLTAQKWYTYFADYILFRAWDRIPIKEEDNG